MALRSALKQPEENAQRDPGEKDGLAITVERRGLSSEVALRCLSRPSSMSGLQRATLERRMPSEAWAPGIRLERQS